MKLKSNLSLLSGLHPLHLHLLSILILHFTLLVQHLQLHKFLLDLLLIPSSIEPSSHTDHKVFPFLHVLHGLLLDCLQAFRNLRNVPNFVSVGSLGPLSPLSFYPLTLSKQFCDPLDSDKFKLDEFILEQLHKFLVSQVLLQTFYCQEPSLLRRFEDSSHATFVRIHEGNHGGEHGSNTPAGAPGFLMEVGEGGAYKLADLEAAIVGQEANFGRREGVVFWQFKDAMIEALFVFFFKIIEAEVEVQVAISLQDDRWDGLFLNGKQLLVNPHVRYLLCHSISRLLGQLQIYITRSELKTSKRTDPYE